MNDEYKIVFDSYLRIKYLKMIQIKNKIVFNSTYIFEINQMANFTFEILSFALFIMLSDYYLLIGKNLWFYLILI